MPNPADIADWSPYGRGTCPVCGRPFDLTKKGVVRHHLARRKVGDWYRPQRCDGAGQAPTPEGA